MKKRVTTGWAAVGAVLSLCALIAVVYGLNSEPRFQADPSKVVTAAEEVLNCARTGDWESLGKILYGDPSLGEAPNRDSSVQNMIWYSYLESLQYSISESPNVTEAGVSLNVTINCLDISAVMDSLKETAPATMARKASQTDDESLIYDESHNYRDTFVTEVLRDATAQILQAEPQTTEREVTLQFVRSDGQWQAVPNDELLGLLTGFVSE